jgi:hypothetical protein
MAVWSVVPGRGLLGLTFLGKRLRIGREDGVVTAGVDGKLTFWAMLAQVENNDTRERLTRGAEARARLRRSRCRRFLALWWRRGEISERRFMKPKDVLPLPPRFPSQAPRLVPNEEMGQSGNTWLRPIQACWRESATRSAFNPHIQGVALTQASCSAV